MSKEWIKALIFSTADDLGHFKNSVFLKSLIYEKQISPLLPLLTTCSSIDQFRVFFLLHLCVHLFLPVVNHTHNHGNYNLSPGEGGLTKHLMCCMHHSQEKVCPFTLAFKILLLVWNSWDWDRNKNRALSMEYHYGLQALIYLSGDQRAVVVGDSVLSLQGGTSIPHFSVTEEKKLSCFALLGYDSLLLCAGFSSLL